MVSKEHIFAYPRTRQFIQAAIAEGAHLKNPVRVGEDAWIRQRNMVGAYFASDATLEGLASVMGRITRERVRQIIKRGMANLWKMSSPDLQQKFPLDSIPLDKPRSLADRVANSLRHANSPMAQVLAGLEVGEPINQIVQEHGVSSSSLANIRQSVKKIGIEIPYQNRTREQNYWLAQMLAQATDKNLIKSLLTDVKPRFCQVYSQGENRCLIPVTALARESGYHFRNDATGEFVAALKEADIPIFSYENKLKRGRNKGTVLRHYYLTTPFREGAGTAFENTKSLDKFKEPKVRQIAGPKADKFPTTTDFVREKNYRTTAKLLKQLGIRIPTGYRYKMFIAGPDCPVPLFKGKRTSSICYPIDQDETLRRWIIDKVKSSFPSSLPN